MTDLVSADEIADFPGAPFPADVLTAAGETVRGLAGWHIAPSQTDTITLDSYGGRVLWLPSMFVTEVTEVRDVLADTVITGVTFDPNGRLYYANGYFPCGIGAVEVEFDHGYEACPADLLPVVAAICRESATTGRPAQQVAGPFVVSYKSDSTMQADVLDRYTLLDVA